MSAFSATIAENVLATEEHIKKLRAKNHYAKKQMKAVIRERDEALEQVAFLKECLEREKSMVESVKRKAHKKLFKMKELHTSMKNAQKTIEGQEKLQKENEERKLNRKIELLETTKSELEVQIRELVHELHIKDSTVDGMEKTIKEQEREKHNAILSIQEELHRVKTQLATCSERCVHFESELKEKKQIIKDMTVRSEGLVDELNESKRLLLEEKEKFIREKEKHQMSLSSSYLHRDDHQASMSDLKLEYEEKIMELKQAMKHQEEQFEVDKMRMCQTVTQQSEQNDELIRQLEAKDREAAEATSCLLDSVRNGQNRIGMLQTMLDSSSYQSPMGSPTKGALSVGLPENTLMNRASLNFGFSPLSSISKAI